MTDLPKLAILSIINGAAPERATELEGMWRNHEISAGLSRDEGGPIIRALPFADCGLINFNHMAMLRSWFAGLATCAAWKDLSSVISLPEKDGFYPVNSENEDLISRDYSRYLEAAISLSGDEPLDSVRIEEGLIRPSVDLVPSDNAEQLTYDLLWIAGASTFLHEIRHITIDKAVTDSRKVELACDAFAWDFIIDRASEYAKNQGYTQKGVLLKRAMGILTNSWKIVALSKKPGSETDDHPSPIQRLLMTIHRIDGMGFGEDSPIWVYFSCAMLAHMRHHGVKVTPTQAFSNRQLCDFLLAKVATIGQGNPQ